jgi:hypothetical protein
MSYLHDAPLEDPRTTYKPFNREDMNVENEFGNCIEADKVIGRTIELFGKTKTLSLRGIPERSESSILQEQDHLNRQSRL